MKVRKRIKKVTNKGSREKRMQGHRGRRKRREGEERERHGRGRDGVRRDGCRGDANHRRQHSRNPGDRGVRPLFEPRSSREEG